MSRAALAGGWRLRRYDRLSSTSDLCIRLAAAGEPEGLAILARQQSAGRGSRGRTWESPAGNLFLSVLLRPAGGIAEAGRYSLLAGVALFDSLAEFLPSRTTLSLKWPNDVLLGRAKLAGILIESAATVGGHLDWLVIGLGANLAAAPVVPGREIACLADTGIVPPTPEMVAGALLARLAHWLSVEVGDGFAAIGTAWLARAHALGAPLHVATAGGARHGHFAGLTEDGALLLETDAGVQAIGAGEVTPRSEGVSCCS